MPFVWEETSGWAGWLVRFRGCTVDDGQEGSADNRRAAREPAPGMSLSSLKSEGKMRGEEPDQPVLGLLCYNLKSFMN